MIWLQNSCILRNGRSESWPGQIELFMHTVLRLGLSIFHQCDPEPGTPTQTSPPFCGIYEAGYNFPCVSKPDISEHGITEVKIHATLLCYVVPLMCAIVGERGKRNRMPFFLCFFVVLFPFASSLSGKCSFVFDLNFSVKSEARHFKCTEEQPRNNRRKSFCFAK